MYLHNYLSWSHVRFELSTKYFTSLETLELQYSRYIESLHEQKQSIKDKLKQNYDQQLAIINQHTHQSISSAHGLFSSSLALQDPDKPSINYNGQDNYNHNYSLSQPSINEKNGSYNHITSDRNTGCKNNTIDSGRGSSNINHNGHDECIHDTDDVTNQQVNAKNNDRVELIHYNCNDNTGDDVFYLDSMSSRDLDESESESESVHSVSSQDNYNLIIQNINQNGIIINGKVCINDSIGNNLENIIHFDDVNSNINDNSVQDSSNNCNNCNNNKNNSYFTDKKTKQNAKGNDETININNCKVNNKQNKKKNRQNKNKNKKKIINTNRQLSKSKKNKQSKSTRSGYINTNIKTNINKMKKRGKLRIPKQNSRNTDCLPFGYYKIITGYDGVKKYHCMKRGCKQVYPKQTGVYHHYIKMHTRRFECNICKSCFGGTSQLKAHKRIHTNEKPFVCKYKSCKKRFSMKQGLICHERTHTGETPYQCSYCQKTFANKSNCKIHERIHTNEKPYKCRHRRCNKKFTTTSNRNSHESRVHD